MLIRMPGLDAEQIAKWIDDAIEAPATGEAAVRRLAIAHQESGFDFEKVREALHRTRAKTWVRLIKPLRGLRRNQGAVNDSLIDAVDALLAVNKQMASELAALRREMAALRTQAAQRGND